MANEATQIEEQRLGGLNKARFRNRLMTGSKIAASVATGGVGYAASKEIKRRAAGALSGRAEKAAAFLKKKKGIEGAAPENKLSGTGFWMIFALSIFDEVSDVVLSFSVILPILIGLIISFTIFFYLAYQGVSMTTKKLVTWIIAVIIEMIPGLNMIPFTYPLSLLLTKWFENSEALKKVAVARQKLHAS